MSVTDPLAGISIPAAPAVVPAAPALPDEPASVPRPNSPEVPQRQHPSISDAARDLLMQARQAILDEPHQFLMTTWDCGTAACIAGHIGRIVGRRCASGREAYDSNMARVSANLGIDLERSAKLCHWHYWPAPFVDAYEMTTRNDDLGARAEVGAARIIHFIETGE